MTSESHAWRDIARRIEQKRGYCRPTPLRLCAWLRDAEDVEAIDGPTGLRMERRLYRLLSPDSTFGVDHWWPPGDTDCRILACGLLAAISEEEAGDP